jgi:hypothetical protein
MPDFTQVDTGRYGRKSSAGCNVLTAIESAAVSEIRRRGGSASRAQIVQAVRCEVDITREAVHLVVDRSPIIAKLQRNTYAVRNA